MGEVTSISSATASTPHHGLHATTSDFKNCWPSSRSAGLRRTRWVLFRDYEADWSDFENGMAEIGLSQINEDLLR